MRQGIVVFLSITAAVTLCVIMIHLRNYQTSSRPVPGGGIISKNFSTSGYVLAANYSDQVNSGGIISENFSTSGYVLATNYSDQVNSGLRNMMSLQCWASSLKSGIKVVLPFLRNGSFFGFKPSLLSNVSEQKGPSFFDIVDIETWSKFTKKRKYSALATWEEFLNKAPKKIILVDHGCERVTQSFLGYAMKFAESNGFEVLRRVCTTARKKLLTSEEYKTLIYGSHKPNETVVLFRLWGGITSLLQRLMYREGPISDLHSCDLQHGIFSYENIPPSKKIQQNGKQYIEKYLKSEKGYIAIMIRLERLLYKKGSSEAAQNSVGKRCINHILNEVTKWKNHGFKEIFLAMDTGKHGSGSFSKERNITIPNRMSTELFNRLYSDTSLSYSEWEESFDSVTDFSEAGYIGAIQQYVAANAKVLLLAGGGTFQARTLGIHRNIYAHVGGNSYRDNMCT